MERVDRIYAHPTYQLYLEQLKQAEADRCFCRHTIEHFLDVARIAMLYNLKWNLGIEEDLIYATGLLHDIGRVLQYTKEIPHEEASAAIAPDIMKDCGFTEAEMNMVVSAILSHRKQEVNQEKTLGGIIYKADKVSRNCFSCEVKSQCNWPEEKKNLQIKI